MKRKSRRLVVEKEGMIASQIPADQVDGVYVLSSAVSITSEAIRVLSENGASLSFFNRKGEPYSFLLSPDTFSHAELRARQIDVSRSQQGLILARSILRGKLANQAATLRYYAKSRKTSQPGMYDCLQKGADQIKALCAKFDAIQGTSGHDMRGRLMSVEAEAAIHYWGQIKALLPHHLEFVKRERRGATDAVNSSFNYGYGILYSKVFAKICRAGLDPYVGFFHSWRPGKAALLYDFVEGFRQYFVDRPLLSWMLKKGTPMVENERLTRETREKLAMLVLNRMNGKIRYENRMTVAETIIGKKARDLARAIQSDGEYTHYVWPW